MGNGAGLRFWKPIRFVDCRFQLFRQDFSVVLAHLGKGWESASRASLMIGQARQTLEVAGAHGGSFERDEAAAFEDAVENGFACDPLRRGGSAQSKA